MTETKLKMPYAPTFQEVHTGMKLACSPIYAGRWRFAVVVYSLLQGLGLGTLFFGLAFLTSRGIGASTESFGYTLSAFFIFFGFLYWCLERGIKRRRALAYLNSAVMHDQELVVSQKGIAFSNGRSKSFRSWQDIGNIIEAKDIIVLTDGNQGLIIPDRVLKFTGEPRSMHTQIMQWHHAATGSK